MWLNCVDVQYNVITYYKYLFFFCMSYLIILIKWTLDKFISLDMLVGLWCPKGCSSQAVHPQKDVFDLCPVFTKILTCHNSLLYWEHRVIFINICLNPMKAPHAFISSIKPVWSVIALEGAHVELRTLERHCVIYWSFLCSKIWTHHNYLFGVDISHLHVFTNHDKFPYSLVPSIWPIDQWCL